MSQNIREIANFIWSVADELLRDNYKRSKYADVVYPFTVLRRLDCVLEPSHEKVQEAYRKYKKELKDLSGVLCKTTGFGFYNTSKYTFKKLLDNPDNIKENFLDYLNGYSDNIQEIIEKFKFRNEIQNLYEKGLLYKVVKKFTDPVIALENLSNHEMGYVFEELIRKYNEATNENPGEHFTPREIIHLMANILFSKDKRRFSQKGVITTAYDPTCGTGGMLTVAKEEIQNLNPQAKIELFGQESNDETYAACKADMLVKGEDPDKIKYGSSFSKDGFIGKHFDYIFSNPPYGKKWSYDEEFIKAEAAQGDKGRFEAGLPGISDGQLLFLQHMISKMHTDGHQTRIAIVFNGSPLFNGDAGEGESEIRRWIFENDWLDAIIGLPNQLFYNTGIFTYIWVLTNKKENSRRGKISLIDARDLYVKMGKSLGDKRNEISAGQIAEITELYLGNKPNGRVKIFRNTDFAYRKVQVDRPLRLNFQVTAERIARLDEQTAFKNLAISKKKSPKEKEKEEQSGLKEQEQIKSVLKSISKTLYKDSKVFESLLDDAFKKSGYGLKAPLKKAIFNALSEKDETAETVYDGEGNPQPDSELRDYEYIPYEEDVLAYFKREVIPYA
ncbi:MAG: class I SAM-dependent DNA methyltransferase, partial [Candidatus Brocadiaceae bacterium]|nr:class I SAM-dependent DNA methyltransferase [Candidatus Brocadiaceae bacterium]